MTLFCHAQHLVLQIYQKDYLLTFAGLAIFQKIASEISTEYRFYLLSFSDSAKRFAQAARNHCQVEINLHWSFDVCFHEDLSRARRGHSAENLSVIRRIALDLLKKENSKKIGIATKRKKAGWDIIIC